MKIAQRKNCDSCRALGLSPLGAIRCELGYSIKIKLYHGSPTGAIPLKPCPKPIQWDEYWEARDANKQEERKDLSKKQ